MLRISILAIGRLRAGPEKTMIDDYLSRAAKAGAGQGLGPFEVTELESRRGTTEAMALEGALRPGAVHVVLDERGRQMTSPALAALLGEWRDQGKREVCLMIGGADGIDQGLQEKAAMSLSLGPMVWPHMLARVMLAEQLYRATTILAGGPYHRA
jgi:23S rRNA (pseudouridine1915-N3)-methyltransferase